MNKILIVAPIRNRDWILGDYLNCLKSLDYEKQLIAFHFLLNDCQDFSELVLRQWQIENEQDYRYIRISKIELGAKKDIGEAGYGRESRKGKYENFAFFRNTLFQIARLDSEINYIFSVDSDVLVKPDCLKNLLSKQKDIIAALIRNGKDAFNFLPFTGNRAYVPEGVSEVMLTGACYLISEKVFRNENIKYKSCKTGEDEGFCISARQQGIKSYILPDMQRHIIDRRLV